MSNLITLTVLLLYCRSAGAGMTCCYSESHGYLMYSGDSEYGSQAARAHPWGKPPYGSAPYVPTLSHWYHDVMPWYFCCEWQMSGSSDWAQYDCFNRYMTMRPTGDCVNYNPPGFGKIIFHSNLSCSKNA